MKVEHYTHTQLEPAHGVPGVSVRWVINEKDGAPNFAMRIFDVEPGATTPFHQHDWEHEVFVLSGDGAVGRDGGQSPIGPGSVVFIPGKENHQFINQGEDVLRFICLIPI